MIQFSFIDMEESAISSPEPEIVESTEGKNSHHLLMSKKMCRKVSQLLFFPGISRWVKNVW